MEKVEFTVKYRLRDLFLNLRTSQIVLTRSMLISFLISRMKKNIFYDPGIQCKSIVRQSRPKQQIKIQLTLIFADFLQPAMENFPVTLRGQRLFNVFTSYFKDSL